MLELFLLLATLAGYFFEVIPFEFALLYTLILYGIIRITDVLRNG